MPKEKHELIKQNLSREEASKALDELRQRYGNSLDSLNTANEAKTRLLVIDHILETLGWHKDDFNPEDLVRGSGFTDYLLKSDGSPYLIIEAKRAGETFIRLGGELKKTDYSLSYVRSHFGRAVSEVINQAEDYAKHIAVPFALVTNGLDWILFQTHPIGKQEVRELKCLCFSGFFKGSSSFDTFWDLLSKPNVLNGSLHEYFTHLNSLSYDYCVSPDKSLAALKWFHDSVEDSYITKFYDWFFSEMTDPKRRNMLRVCFVSNHKLDQYQGELKRALRDEAPEFIENVVELDSNFENAESLHLDSGDNKGRVVLIVGSVGSGKSTFVNKVLMEAKNPDTAKSRRIEWDYIIVDLINQYELPPEQVAPELLGKVNELWQKLHPEYSSYEILKTLFSLELKKLRNGAFAREFEHDSSLLSRKEAELLEEYLSKTEKFLGRSFRYNRDTKKRGTVVFIDNIDRLSDTYQSSVYSFAHKFADDTGAIVILTMREGTYYKGKDHGFLDIRSNDTVYHLQAPDLIQVIAKRVEYIETVDKESEKDKTDQRLAGWKRNHNWPELQSKFLSYSAIVKQTFLNSEHKNQAIELLASVAWHDVRHFLSLLKELHLLLSGEQKPWSIEAMIAALLTPNDISYSKTFLPNLYFPTEESYACHFLKLRILYRLLCGQSGGDHKRGMSYNAIRIFSSKYYYHVSWINKAIRGMVRERLIECLDIPSEGDSTKLYELVNKHRFRISPLGVVMLDKICYHPVYITLVGRSTPFHDQAKLTAFCHSLEDLFSLLKGEDRLTSDFLDLMQASDCHKLFAQYLIEAFEDEKPLGNIAAHYTEIHAAENRVETLIALLQKISGIESKPRRMKAVKFDQHDQGVLFSAIHDESSMITRDLLLDEHICSNVLEPKIFWALVRLFKQNRVRVRGSEIAKTLNQFLLDDLHHVESSNISKALRGEHMKQVPWLLQQGDSRNKTFSLSDCWHNYWNSYMKGIPP